MACPPLYMTSVPAADVKRGDGNLVVKFQETFCRVTKDGFAASSGELIKFRPWQRNLAGAIYAKRPDGHRNHRRALIGLPRKNGKLLNIATPVLTGGGWSTMGELQPGDYVHTADGTLARVTWVSEIETQPAYRVSFADGAILEASATHQWLVNDRMRETARVVTTQELADTLVCCFRKDRRYTVNVPTSLDRESLELPVDPYTLGAWLGDGDSGVGRISGQDVGIFEMISKAGYEPAKYPAPGLTVHATCYGLTAALRPLNVLHNKHVPEQYLVASEDQRLALLRGLMDTDGGVNVGPNTPRVEFTNTNKWIAEAVLFLARSLGWKATIRAGRATLNGHDCGPKWRVAWTASSQRSPFTLWRKTKLLADHMGKRSRTNAVTDVSPVGDRQVRCISVDHPSRVFLAGTSLTPTHNSAIGSGFALHGLLTDGDGAEVYGLACDKDQAKIVFNVAKRMVELDPQLSEIIKCYRDVLEVPGAGSIYKALSSEAYTKEGLNPTTVIYDELHAAPNDELYDVMLDAFGARKDPLMICITTAGVKSDQTGGDSLCYRLYQYGQQICSKELIDPTFFFAWWGSPDNADPSSPETWEASNPGYNDLLDPADFISVYAQHSAKGTINDFKTKRMNQWVSQVKAWMPEGAWNGCQREFNFVAPPKGIVLGFDGSRSGDSTALVGVTVEPDPKLKVFGVWEKPNDASAEWRVPREEVKEAIRQACRTYDVRELAADEYIWVGELEELLEEGIPVVAFPQTATRMGPATQRFFELVRDRRLSHDGHLALARHIGNAQLKADPRGARLVKDARGSPRKIDLAVAGVMAVDRAGYWLSQDGPGTWEGVPIRNIKFVW